MKGDGYDGGEQGRKRRRECTAFIGQQGGHQEGLEKLGLSQPAAEQEFVKVH